MTEDPDQQPNGQLLTVTTRSRLRSARFFPAMLLANLLIRRQLARTEGVVRWASLVASPTEFWTITAWRSRHAMQEFTRSNEHGQIMWRFSRWLSSLWLMRWRPGPTELGSWSGLRLASPEPATAPSQEPSQEWPVLATALEDLPELRSAIGSDGVASYDSSSRARRERQLVQGAAGVVLRIHAGGRLLVALVELIRLRRALRGDPHLLRSVVGVGRPSEVYFLSVWVDQAGASRFLHGPWAREAAERWGDGLWAGAWLPENEFGHWDGLRVRRERRQRNRSGAGNRE